MEWSFRTFSQWQDILNLSQPVMFHKSQYKDSPAKHISEILDDRKDIHKNRQHGLALCYNMSKANIMEVVVSVLEVLPIVLEIEKETFYW